MVKIRNCKLTSDGRPARRAWGSRACAVLLAGVLAAGLAPASFADMSEDPDIVTVTTSCPTAGDYFSDLVAGSWYEEEGCIDYVVERGIMRGYENTYLFGPEDPLTRAQTIVILYRAIVGDDSGLTWDASVYDSIADTTGFSDVEDGQFYTEALNWAFDNGYAEGFDGEFRPNDSVTREELGTFLGRCGIEHVGVGVSSLFVWPFEDEDTTSPWAQEYIAWCNANGVMEGYDIGGQRILFGSQDQTTRAQAAAAISRFDKNVLLAE